MNDEDQALPEKTYLREDDDDDDDEEEERRDVEDEEGKDEALFSIFRRKPCRRVSNWKGHGPTPGKGLSRPTAIHLVRFRCQPY